MPVKEKEMGVREGRQCKDSEQEKERKVRWKDPRLPCNLRKFQQDSQRALETKLAVNGF